MHPVRNGAAQLIAFGRSACGPGQSGPCDRPKARPLAGASWLGRGDAVGPAAESPVRASRIADGLARAPRVRCSRRFLLALPLLAALLLAPIAVAGTFEEGRAHFAQNDLAGALPYFEKAAAVEYAGGEAHAWLAETYRRLGRPAAADSAARMALARAPCSSMAHDVLACNFNPQYGDWQGANADSSWAHAQAAVSCDSTDGNAWMTLWVEALRRNDRESELRAYRRLVGDGFFTRPVLAYARWLLRGVPEHSLLLVNGDFDTVPCLALQEVEGLRRDVAVINISMLENDWYRRLQRDRYGVPMPFGPDDLDSLSGSYDSRGAWRGAAFQLDLGWQEMLRAGRLGRPLVYSTTVDFEAFGDTSRILRLEGPWLRALARPTDDVVDTARVRASLFELSAADFSGSWVSARDRVPQRASISGLLSNPIGAAVRYAQVASGNPAKALAMLDWARAFARTAGALAPLRSSIEECRGNVWMAHDEYDKAIQDYDEAIRLDPKAAGPFIRRGEAWRFKEEFDKAIQDCDEAIRLDPKDAGAFFCRGRAWGAKMNIDHAIQDYDEAIRLDPNDADFYHSRGLAWDSKREYDKAIKDYDEAIRLDPKDAANFYSRGLAWNDKQEYDKAIRDYDEAIRLDSTNALVFYSRGLTRTSKKEYDKAIQDYSEVIRLEPNHARVFRSRAIAWMVEKEYDKAIQDYGDAIRLDPKNVSSFCDRARASEEKKQHDAAIQDYDAAIRLDPQHRGDYLVLRGNAWRAKGDLDRAIQDYDEAIGLDAKSASAYLNRSVAQMVARRAEAIEGFQAVLKIEQSKPDAKTPQMREFAAQFDSLVASIVTEQRQYAVVRGNLAARQIGDEAAAGRFLADARLKLTKDWPGPVVRFLRGEIDGETLLRLADDDRKQTEARCYLGLDRALRGRKDEAQEDLRWVRDHGRVTLAEYVIALAELERLERGEK